MRGWRRPCGLPAGRARAAAGGQAGRKEMTRQQFAPVGSQPTFACTYTARPASSSPATIPSSRAASAQQRVAGTCRPATWICRAASAHSRSPTLRLNCGQWGIFCKATARCSTGADLAGLGEGRCSLCPLSGGTSFRFHQSMHRNSLRRKSISDPWRLAGWGPARRWVWAHGRSAISFCGCVRTMA